jgi:hypothetical protein
MVTCFRGCVVRFGAPWEAIFLAHLFAVVHCFSPLLAAFAVSFAVMAGMPTGILVGPGYYMSQQVRAICWLVTSLVIFEPG